MNHSATYSPEDDKLRLYPASRLDADTYARVKAAGLSWAPKQELFFAVWSPAREDLLTDLCSDIGDEDTSLVDRAEDRAERFDGYSDRRAADADRARAAVDAIADGIPIGQPILVGHHSEKHARRDAERIESGMRKAVAMWRTSKYWQARAAGALRHAKYKERADVRHRRIKTLGAERRKSERSKSESETWLKLWSSERLTLETARVLADRCWLTVEGATADHPHGRTAYDVLRHDPPAWEFSRVVEVAKRVYPKSLAHAERWIEHLDNRLAYEKAMLAESIGGATSDGTMAGRFNVEVGGSVLVGRNNGEWVKVLRVNKADGAVNSLTTTAPAGVTWQRSWKIGIEEVHDYRAPTDDEAAKAKAASKLPPICNYPGDGFREMTKVEWDARHKWSDFPYIGTVEATASAGKHRARQMPGKNHWDKVRVFITDQKRVDPPRADSSLFEAPIDLPPDAPAAGAPPVAPVAGLLQMYAAPQPRVDQGDPRDAAFLAMEKGALAGVQVVVAPQLFATPPALAARMIDLAAIMPAHRVLEPSAGTGAILDELADDADYCDDAGEIVAIEINDRLVDSLRGRLLKVDVRRADFLECGGELGVFDAILMNPPFANAVDIKHILHARGMLAPGGRLVALCANGPRQREALQPLATHWEDLPPGSFKESGTNVNVALLVMEAAQ